MKVLTLEVLRELVNYDRETGMFTWRPRGRGWFKRERQFLTWNKRFAEKQINSTCGGGYVQVCINDARYKAHRLAWLYEYGALPNGEIDHINHDRADNRIANLRDVTRAENSKNKSPYRAGERMGVGRHAGKWAAYICVGGKQKTIGHFESKGDAIAARATAERAMGFHENHGVAA